jgi:dTDP-4-amino-4,6-dideoxygalactose transaminase
MIPFLEFKAQFRRFEPEIREAVNRVLESGWYILGRELAAFEETFAAWNGAAFCRGAGSGTEAIHLALIAAGVRPGDDVITAANTCVPTAAAIAFTGARLRLADCHPGTLTLAPAALEAAITAKTRAIVPVHLYGHPCDMDAISALAEARGIAVIEDCAQAHGSLYKGRKCGGSGLAGAFSFYPTKNLGAYGDAGAVVTDDAEIAERLRMLRNYGERERYYHEMPGFNSRLDEIQAAILQVKLRHLDADNRARRERAAAYRDGLAGLPIELPHETARAQSNYHLFVIRTPERDRLQAFLGDEGIGTLLHYPVPIHRQPAYHDLGYGAGAFPVAEKACNEVISLPLYPELSLEAVERVADAVRRFFASG